jgi:hypothetical protein
MNPTSLLKIIAAPFEKLDDTLQTIVDATFGWSKTLQEAHLHKVKTESERGMVELQAQIEQEKARLEAERLEKEREYEEQRKAAHEEKKRKALEHEHKLYQQGIEFKIKMVEELTKIVSGLQNEHSRRVMAIISDFRSQQTLAIRDLEEENKVRVEQIMQETTPYKDSHPELYDIKLEQLRSLLQRHNGIVEEFTIGVRKDLERIQTWLLDSSKFNAQQFVLEISNGQQAQAQAFQKFLQDRHILLDDSK